MRELPAGCRWRRRNRATGALVGLYKADEAGLDTDGGQNWYLVCEDHGRLLSFPTRQSAEWHGGDDTTEWCDGCREERDRT